MHNELQLGTIGIRREAEKKHERERKTKNTHKIKKLNVTSKTSYYIGI